VGFELSFLALVGLVPFPYGTGFCLFRFMISFWLGWFAFFGSECTDTDELGAEVSSLACLLALNAPFFLLGSFLANCPTTCLHSVFAMFFCFLISGAPTRLAVRDAEGALGEFVPKSRSRAGPAEI
jgi:hypothetical protein